MTATVTLNSEPINLGSSKACLQQAAKGFLLVKGSSYPFTSPLGKSTGKVESCLPQDVAENLLSLMGNREIEFLRCDAYCEETK